MENEIDKYRKDIEDAEIMLNELRNKHSSPDKDLDLSQLDTKKEEQNSSTMRNFR